MVVARTPWLKRVDDGILPTYNLVQSTAHAPWVLCAATTDEYFDIPKGAIVRFVVHSRPSKDRYPAHVEAAALDRILTFNGDLHDGFFTLLSNFLLRFDLGKTYYVECEIK